VSCARVLRERGIERRGACHEYICPVQRTPIVAESELFTTPAAPPAWRVWLTVRGASRACVQVLAECSER